MNRDFKGIWIPKEIWFCQKMTMQEKIFYVEIDSLDNEDGCFANNAYFSKFFGISKARVSLVIRSLVTKKIITSKIVYKKGTKEVLKRILKISLDPLYKSRVPSHTKAEEPPLQNVVTLPLEKYEDNNTSINNTIISPPNAPQGGLKEKLESSKNIPHENYEKWTEALKKKILEYHKKNGNDNGIRFHKDFSKKTTDDFGLIFEEDGYTKEQVLEAVEVIFTNSFYVKGIERAGVFRKRLRDGVVGHIKAEQKTDQSIQDSSENIDRVNRETRQRQIKTKALDVKRDEENIFFEKIEDEFRSLSALERKKYYDLLPKDVSKFSKKQCALNQYIAVNYPEFQYLVVN